MSQNLILPPDVEYFTLSEFACKCGCAVPSMVFENIVKTARNLDKLRLIIDQPIVIKSGYRCPVHNKKKGGKSQSLHLRGLAVDIRCTKIPPKKLYNLILSLCEVDILKNGGLKKYSTFVHYDIRGTLTLF